MRYILWWWWGGGEMIPDYKINSPEEEEEISMTKELVRSLSGFDKTCSGNVYLIYRLIFLRIKDYY